jgi:hypothetical protein
MSAKHSNKGAAPETPQMGEGNAPRERFITYLILSHGMIYAKTETEYKAEGLPEDWDDFVWQFAASKEAAIARHDEALDAYINDVNRGREPKATY